LSAPVVVTINAFGGLDMRDDPLIVGATAARDLKNVRLDRPGRLATRGGFVTRESTTQSAVLGLYRYRQRGGGGNDSVVAIRSANTLRVYPSGVASFLDKSPVSGGTMSGSGVEFSDGSFYAARTDNTIAKLDQTMTCLGLAGTPEAYYLTTTASFRMVAARAAIGASPSNTTVYFSNAGDATTWGVNNWVALGPAGIIRGATRFRELVFVFLDTSFAVFTGETVDSSGNPVFRYRPVDVGVSCNFDGAVTTGPDGVYFVAHDGIYRTAGDAPVLVSQALQPLFDGATDADWSGVSTISSPRLYSSNDRLYFINNSAVFYYTYTTGQWAYDTFSPGVQFLVKTPAETARSIYFIDGTGKMCEAGDTLTTDDGAAISWSYKSGKYPLSKTATPAVIRESRMFGTGTVTLALSSDLYADQSGSVTLGTAPTPAAGWLQKDQEANYFQHTLSGSGQATVEGMAHFVANAKDPEVG
jgi:hypothetical protein